MSKRSIRKNRHRDGFYYYTFADRVFLGTLTKQVKDGFHTKESAKEVLYERFPDLKEVHLNQLKEIK